MNKKNLADINIINTDKIKQIIREYPCESVSKFLSLNNYIFQETIKNGSQPH